MTGDFGKIAIGAPLYHSRWQWVTWWSWLVRYGLRADDVLLNDMCLPGGVPIPRAHNLLVKAFLETDCDTLCIVEDDHADCNNLTVERMRANPANQQFDIVCASYTNRRGVPRPMGYIFMDWDAAHTYPLPFDENEDPHLYRLGFNNAEVALEGTQEYDGAALGCVLIRRWLLEKMAGGRPLDRVSWFIVYNHQGLDVPFYAWAKELGARVAVDRSVWLDHIGEYTYSKTDFVNWRANGGPPEPEQPGGDAPEGGRL